MAGPLILKHSCFLRLWEIVDPVGGAPAKLRIRCTFLCYNPLDAATGITFWFERAEAMPKRPPGKPQKGKLVPAAKPTLAPATLELVASLSGAAKVVSSADHPTLREIKVAQPDLRTIGALTMAHVTVEVNLAGGRLRASAEYVPLDTEGNKAKLTKVFVSPDYFTPALNELERARMQGSSNVPRLVTTLNDAFVEQPTVPADAASDLVAGGPKALELIRKRLVERLKTPLDAVWSLADKRTGAQLLRFPADDATLAELLETLRKEHIPKRFMLDPNENVDPNKKSKDDALALWVANELWARQISEILLLSPYDGTGQFYDVEHKFVHDEDVYRKFTDQADPAHGLAFACQYLTTMGVRSRGFIKTATVPLMIEAGSNAANTMTSIGGVVFAEAGTPLDNSQIPGSVAERTMVLRAGGRGANESVDNALRTSKTLTDPAKCPGFGPGSIFIYSNLTLSAFETRTVTDSGTRQELLREYDMEVEVDNPAFATALTQKPRPKQMPPKKLKVTKHFDAPAMKETSPGGKSTFTPFVLRGPGEDPVLPDNQLQSHVAFVLRTDLDKHTVQLFDTGGCGVAARAIGVTLKTDNAIGLAGGNFDDPDTDNIPGTRDPFRGVATLPEVSYGDLKNAVGLMKKSRPLGFARLLIYRAPFDLAKVTDAKAAAQTYKSWLLYASPVVRMHAAGDEDNFTLARYAWSLRELPGREDLGAVWTIYAPKGVLARTMICEGKLPTNFRERMLQSPPSGTELLHAGRAANMSSIIATARDNEDRLRKGTPKKPLSPKIDDTTYLSNRVQDVVDIYSQPNGKAFVAYTRPRTAARSKLRDILLALRTELPWNRSTANFDAAPGASGFGEAVTYFDSEWS